MAKSPRPFRITEARVRELAALGSDPETRELAAATQRTVRICDSIRAWLERHPVRCRCRVCRHLRTHNPSYREQIAALAYNLWLLADMTDNDRPATLDEYAGLAGG